MLKPLLLAVEDKFLPFIVKLDKGIAHVCLRHKVKPGTKPRIKSGLLLELKRPIKVVYVSNQSCPRSESKRLTEPIALAKGVGKAFIPMLLDVQAIKLWSVVVEVENGESVGGRFAGFGAERLNYV